MLSKVSQANSDGRPQGDADVVVLHHTNCGVRDLPAFPEILAQYFEIPVTALPEKAVTDPRSSVRIDAEAVRSCCRSDLEGCASNGSLDRVAADRWVHRSGTS